GAPGQLFVLTYAFSTSVVLSSSIVPLVFGILAGWNEVAPSRFFSSSSRTFVCARSAAFMDSVASTESPSRISGINSLHCFIEVLLCSQDLFCGIDLILQCGVGCGPI